MTINDMKKKAQTGLFLRYGFKPGIAQIKPLETDYSIYLRFEIGHVTYVLNDGIVKRLSYEEANT